MNSNISTFIANARDAGFTIRYRNRDGKHTFTASVSGNCPNFNERSALVGLATRSCLALTFGKDNGEYINFRAEETQAAPQRDADGNLPRLPGWQWSLVKQFKAAGRSRDRLQAVVDSGDVQGREEDLLEEQLAAQEALIEVLNTRIEYYNLKDYL